MNVEWIALSPEKRKVLHILLTINSKTADDVARCIGISRGSIFNKIGGSQNFKKIEYERILEVLNVTEDELEKCARSFMTMFIIARQKRL